MKITELDLQTEGKRYFCKQINEVVEVKDGNLIAATRSFSMAELLGMEFEEVKEVQNPYARVNYIEKYCSIGRRGNVSLTQEDSHYYDNELFSIANYFNNKEYAEYIAFKETLMRRMDRFAWDHNARVIDWDKNVANYCIIFDNHNKDVEIMVAYALQSSDIYFTSREIAEKAIEEFKEDLIKLYTWKFDV